MLAAGVAAAVVRYPVAKPAPPRPGTVLAAALTGTLATSFHVSGTIAEGRDSSVQTVTGDVDLGRRRAQLMIQLGPALPAEQVLLLPRHTYENLNPPAQLAAAIPRGVRWLVQDRSLTRLLLGADSALSPLQPGLPGSTVIPLGNGVYRLERPAATSPPGEPALPPDTITFWVQAGRVVGVLAISYTRVPGVQGGLAGVLATVTTLHLARFGEPVRVSEPASGSVLSAIIYEQLLQSAPTGALLPQPKGPARVNPKTARR